MAKTKKPVITAAEVTANLRRLFPGKEIQCNEVEEQWNDRPHFYIETATTKVVVIGKQVWVKPTIQRWAAYLMHCNDGYGIYSKMRTKIGTCIPFVYLKKDRNKAEAELVLMACGLKPEPKQTTPVQRLREIGGKTYVDIWNMLNMVQVTNAHFYHGKDGWRNDCLFCYVQTATGSYKFALPKLSNDRRQNIEDEIRGIFGQLLGITASVTIKPKLSEIAA